MPAEQLDPEDIDPTSLMPVVPPGARVTYSRKAGGEFSANLMDAKTGKNLGPAQLTTRPADDLVDNEIIYLDVSANATSKSDFDAAIEMINDLIVLLEMLGKFAIWWQETGLPATKANWRKTEAFRKKLKNKAAPLKLARGRTPSMDTTGAVAASLGPTQVNSHEIEISVKNRRTPMSISEAQHRVARMLIAAGEFAEQERALSNAHIVDDPVYRELTKHTEHLTNALAIDKANRILALDSAVSDNNYRAELMRLFGGGQVSNGSYLPLKVENVREALQLQASNDPFREHQ